MSEAAIVAIGHELTTGRTVDTNSPHIAGVLDSCGVPVALVQAVPDHLDGIQAALEQAARVAGFICCTGGLGPTNDDKTREAIANWAGRPLRFSEEAMAAIRERYTSRGRPMSESNRRQARFPEGAMILPNPIGTAPGFWLESGETICVSMPGVPREMKRMLEEQVVPRLDDAGLVAVEIRSRTLMTWGLPESALDEKIADLFEEPDIELTTGAGRNGISLTLRAVGDDPGRLEARLDDAEKAMRERLGPAIFGGKGATLEGCVKDLLESRNASLSVAESCTGGRVASRLTKLSGVSRVFHSGIVSYSNEAKVEFLGVRSETLDAHGAVSREAATEMAEGLRTRTGVDIAASVTGIAGPTGGTEEKPVGLVYFGVADEQGTTTKRVVLPGDRSTIQHLAALSCLDIVRRRLLGVL